MSSIRHWAAVLTLAGAASTAHATDMLGDTLMFQRAFPTPGTPFWPNDDESTTVATGTGDRIDWFANFTSGFFLRVDPEANRILWNLVTPSSFGGVPNGLFDGFVLTGFRNDIVSVSVSSNDSNLQAFLSNSAREVQVNLNGNNAGGNTGFVLDIQFAPAIPEPGTWALLLAGLGAVAMRVRHQRH